MNPGSLVYLEEAAAGHERAKWLLERLRPSSVVACGHYGELFNRSAQDFRLQKESPAWIVATKRGRFLHPVPDGFGVGGSENWYFSHMLNCLYDCGYCFLQGLFRSASYVWFVNYEAFMAAIDARLAESAAEAIWFFSGYDCDSLVFDRLTGFCDAFLPFFASRPRAWLELRTKSVEVSALERHAPFDNCVVAFSFTPRRTHRAMEAGVPSIERRLDALSRVQRLGWRVGLRFDPLIWSPDHLEQHRVLVDEVFAAVEPETVHSVTLGTFRLPVGFHRRMARQRPFDALLAGPLEEGDGEMSYPEELERELLDGFVGLLEERLPADRIFGHRSRRSAITATQ